MPTLPPSGDVIASPDGTRLAVLNPSLSTLTLYDLAGTPNGARLMLFDNQMGTLTIFGRGKIPGA